jgi:hypothetical protein
MDSIANVLRGLWVPGLSTISGNIDAGLSKWIKERQFSISQAVHSDRFTLDVAALQTVIIAFAGDINRMSCASFETMLAIQAHPVSPRSTGWLLIQNYYASFFAAHALLRMFGISCTQIEPPHIQNIDVVARKYGQTDPGRVRAGNYTCAIDTNKSKLSCELNSQAGGIHQAFWATFAAALKLWGEKVLSLANVTTVEKQGTSARLSELEAAIRFGAYTNGTWLSQVRNSVNYKHEFGCWFPYRLSQPKPSRLRERSTGWLTSPMRIDLNIESEQDLHGFQNTCLCVVALCREMVLELANRCPGQSFVTNGGMALMRLAKIKMN